MVLGETLAVAAGPPNDGVVVLAAVGAGAPKEGAPPNADAVGAGVLAGAPSVDGTVGAPGKTKEVDGVATAGSLLLAAPKLKLEPLVASDAAVPCGTAARAGGSVSAENAGGAVSVAGAPN